MRVRAGGSPRPVLMAGEVSTGILLGGRDQMVLSVSELLRVRIRSMRAAEAAACSALRDLSGVRACISFDEDRLAKERGIMTKFSFRAGGVAIAGLTAAAHVLAQTATTEPPSADSGQQVAEIIVTAERRAERMQDVPLTVTAITSEALAA